MNFNNIEVCFHLHADLKSTHVNTKSRIKSVLESESLDPSITGMKSFDLSNLSLNSDLDFELPTHVRLGHLVEKIVSECIRASSDFQVLHENLQLIEDKMTIGELDFIVQDARSKEIIHLELAYKFYLYDPSISTDPIKNWIGPNRNDSLDLKLSKLKEKQFPLLHHNQLKSMLEGLEAANISQALCFLVSLFMPFEHKLNLSPEYEKAVKGYYLNHKTFADQDHSKKWYHLPEKKEWGIDPAENNDWSSYADIEKQLTMSMNEKQSRLCWEKHRDSYTSFFIVWW